jgi:hypothetical protein
MGDSTTTNNFKLNTTCTSISMQVGWIRKSRPGPSTWSSSCLGAQQKYGRNRLETRTWTWYSSSRESLLVLILYILVFKKFPRSVQVWDQWSIQAGNNESRTQQWYLKTKNASANHHALRWGQVYNDALFGWNLNSDISKFGKPKEFHPHSQYSDSDSLESTFQLSSEVFFYRFPSISSSIVTVSLGILISAMRRCVGVDTTF